MVIAAVVVLLVVDVAGAHDEVEVPAVVGLAARGDRVFLHIGHEVVVTDEDGAFLGVLEGAPGVPWQFAEVSDVNVGPDGAVVVADSGRHEVVRFAPDLHQGTRLPLQEKPKLSFEVAPLGEALVIADTMGHAVRQVAPNGQTLKRFPVRYANGLSVVQREGAQEIAFAATGLSRAMALGPDLSPVSDPAISLFNRWREGRLELPGALPPLRGHPELLDLALGDDDVLLASVCRNTAGDCTVVRVDGKAGTVATVGDIGFLKEQRVEASEDNLGLSELARRSDGAVLVGSPRFDTVLLFEGPDGGPPAPGFCDTCRAGELAARAVELSSLESGPLTWPNGTRVSVFGDTAVKARYASLRRATAGYQAMQRYAKAGLIALLGLLLLLRFVFRQAGTSGAGDRLQRVWKELVVPEAGALATAGLSIVLGAAAGALLLGLAVGGLGGAIGGLAAGGVLAARLWAGPLLLRLRSPGAANRAAAIYLADGAAVLEPGERWLGARFALPEQSFTETLREVFEARKIDDLFEALEQLLPRLAIVAVTERRLLCWTASLLGAPLGSLTARRWRQTPVPPESLGPAFELAQGEKRQRFRLSAGGAPAARATGPAVHHCTECHAPLTRCPHRRGSLAAAEALTLLLPGLGHLVQSRFNAARLQALAALALVGQFEQAYLPQHWGTLPDRPSLWLRPIVAYLAVMLAALIDVVREHRRRERLREETAAALRTEAPAVRGTG